MCNPCTRHRSHPPLPQPSLLDLFVHYVATVPRLLLHCDTYGVPNDFTMEQVVLLSRIATNENHVRQRPRVAVALPAGDRRQSVSVPSHERPKTSSGRLQYRLSSAHLFHCRSISHKFACLASVPCSRCFLHSPNPSPILAKGPGDLIRSSLKYVAPLNEDRNTVSGPLIA